MLASPPPPTLTAGMETSVRGQQSTESGPSPAPTPLQQQQQQRATFGHGNASPSSSSIENRNWNREENLEHERVSQQAAASSRFTGPVVQPRASHADAPAMTTEEATNGSPSQMQQVDNPLDSNVLYAPAPFPPPQIASSAPPSQPSTPAVAEMILHDTSHLHVEIVLQSDTIVMRGVGQDVEPAMLSGSVILNLEEATNIREIALNFTGKARLPQADGRPAHFRQHTTTYTLFTRDWSFLEGTKAHRHTLKAGQHVFPFQLQIDDTFPTTVGTPQATVSYKLRATVVRSSFTSNWVAQRFVTILRGFSPEALEYTQTVEIENTWPQKVMYSIMIPHKAFAAGDSIPALLKFTPIAKGCSVLSIEGSLKQYTSVHWKSSSTMQDSRIVAKCKYAVKDGRAVDMLSQPQPKGLEGSHGPVDGTESALNGRHSTAASPLPSPLLAPGASNDAREVGDGEIETWVRIPVWKFTTPTNGDEPVVIAYKLKFSILLSNLDGHTSELRAALPIHILSHTLLSEARGATHLTRSLLFGTDFEPEPEQTVTLPSYASHVHDRVANALDGPTTTASSHFGRNPLHNIHEGVPLGSGNSGGSGSGNNSFILGSLPPNANGGVLGIRSGHDTPPFSGNYFGMSRSSHSSIVSTPAIGGHHSPPTGTLNDPAALDYVDEGLLLSLGVSNVADAARGPTTASSSRASTPPESRRSSLAASRPDGPLSSARGSPEHDAHDDLPSASTSSSSSSSRSGLFSLPLSLKPFTPFSSNNRNRSGTSGSGGSGNGGGAGGALAVLASQALNAVTMPASPAHALPSASRLPKSSVHNIRSGSTPDSTAAGESSTSSSPRPSTSSSVNGLSTMSDLLNRVPDYQRASQGFLGGGVTPLDASAGLPTYAEVEQVARVRSESSLLELGRAAGSRSHQSGQGTQAIIPSGSAGGTTSRGSVSPPKSGRSSPPNDTPGISVTAASSRSTSHTRRRDITFTLGP